MSFPSVTGNSSESSRADRLLVFRLEHGLYAIDLRQVASIESERAVRDVPGSPDAVLGLVESRGRILTVIDLPRLLDEAPRDCPTCLVRLAAPWSDVAFHVPAAARIGRRGTATPEAPRLLDPAALIDRLSAAGKR